MDGAAGNDTLPFGLGDKNLRDDTTSSIETFRFTNTSGILVLVVSASRTCGLESGEFGTNADASGTFETLMEEPNEVDLPGFVLEKSSAGPGNVRVLNDGLNESITGSATADSIDSGTGNDTINGGQGVDAIVGGRGFDRPVFSDSLADVQVHISDGTFVGICGDAQGDQLGGNESVPGPYFNDIFIGVRRNKVVTGGGGTHVNIHLSGSGRTHVDGVGTDTFSVVNDSDVLSGKHCKSGV